MRTAIEGEANGVRRVCGVGLEVVSVSRMSRWLARYDLTTLGSVFTQRELTTPPNGCSPTHLAICFGAKEALVKALGCGRKRVGWCDVEAQAIVEVKSPSEMFPDSAAISTGEGALPGRLLASVLDSPLSTDDASLAATARGKVTLNLRGRARRVARTLRADCSQSAWSSDGDYVTVVVVTTTSAALAGS